MGLVQRTLVLGVVMVAFLLGACGGDDGDGGSAIAGTYSCVAPKPPPDAPPLPDVPPDTLELREDGTLTHTIGANPDNKLDGTWSADGGSGVLTDHTGNDHSFTIEGDRLLFDDYEVETCTKES